MTIDEKILSRSIDPAVHKTLARAQALGIETAWDRYEAQLPQCGFGELGLCCRNCNLGPCRISPFDEEGPKKGVCGAAAISFIGRGANRRVGTPFEMHTEACIGCGACAEICPTHAVRMEDKENLRILHTWNTSVTLHACPDCGRYFAPQPTAFLREMFPEISDLWILCPACRQKKNLRHLLASDNSR